MRALSMTKSLVMLAAAVAACPGSGAGQLRPLEPMAWEVFDTGRSLAATVGVGGYQEQRASLAGTEGRLLELPNFQLTWRSARIAVEASGTPLRFFEDRARFAEAFGGALDQTGPHRHDSGDYRLATAVRLTPTHWSRTTAVVRFGTRLPTTNNREGLDRDQTDFFGLVGGRLRTSRLRLAAETGVGIYGTRYVNFEQSDLWLYSASAELPLGALTPMASLLGQMDWSSGAQLRGNEDLSELRVGARLGSGLWLQAQLVKGLATFSPGWGAQLSVGVVR
jgi:hypothetical protein